MSWKRHFASAVLIAFMGPAILSIEGCPSTVPVVPEKVNFGVFSGPASTLIYVAQERGIFRKNGIDASIKEYETGLLSVQDLIAGNLDMATASEFVIASKSFKNTDLRIITAINSANDSEMIVRRDRGIRAPKDLIGKKIGVTRGTNLDFFLGTYLTLNDIPLKSVTIVNLRPSEMSAAVSAGRVDAVSTFSPYTDAVKSSLGQNAISWPMQSGQSYYFLLCTKESFIQSHSGLIERILLSLIEAERFLRENEAQARKIIEGRLNMNQAVLSSVWPLYQFRVRLDQDLIILMESEARWMIRNNLSGSREVPDYFTRIYADGLIAVEPSGVGLIR